MKAFWCVKRLLDSSTSQQEAFARQQIIRDSRHNVPGNYI